MARLAAQQNPDLVLYVKGRFPRALEVLGPPHWDKPVPQPGLFPNYALCERFHVWGESEARSRKGEIKTIVDRGLRVKEVMDSGYKHAYSPEYKSGSEWERPFPFGDLK